LAVCEAYLETNSRNLTTIAGKTAQASKATPFNQHGIQARTKLPKLTTSDCRDEEMSKTRTRSPPPKSVQSFCRKEKRMQFGNSENLHHHQPQKLSYRPPEAAHLLSHRVSKLFRNLLTFVLLVWGLLFLILSVTLAYAQDAVPAVHHPPTVNPRAATKPTATDRTVSRRRAAAAHRRGRR